RALRSSSRAPVKRAPVHTPRMFCRIEFASVPPEPVEIISLAVEDHAPGFPLDALGDIERSVRTLRGAVRTRRGLRRTHERILAFEAVGKDFELPGGLAVGKRLEQHVISGHRRRRAI